MQFLWVDDAQTQRWEGYRTPQVPYINDLGLAYVCNNDDLISTFGDFSSLLVMNDVLVWDFCPCLEDWSTEQSVVDMSELFSMTPLARMTRTNQKCCHELQVHHMCAWTSYKRLELPCEKA